MTASNRRLIIAIPLFAAIACASLPLPQSVPATAQEDTTVAPQGQPSVTPDGATQAVVEETPVKADKPELDARWRLLIAGPNTDYYAALDQADSVEIAALQKSITGPAKAAVDLRAALLKMHRGEAAELIEEAPADLAAALDRARRIEAVIGISKPGKVGLLLPLDRPWGAVLEAAFRFGLGEAQVEVVVASSADPEEGIRSLVFEHAVSLVICGPFLERAGRAAVVAQRLGVPLISLGREDGLSGLGDKIFQVGLTNEAQIERLVQGAMEQRGYQRFAVMFPRRASGWRALAVFQAAVQQRGGEVTKIMPYLRSETTFTQAIKSMVGRDNTSLQRNPGYRKCVSEIADTAKGLRKKRAIERCRDRTPPEIDFDAIFIPDSVATVRQIMPFFELSDMVPNLDERSLWRTKKATENEDLKPTPVLGLRQLNSHYFASRSRTNVEGALFVDAYFPYDETRKQPGEFARAFRKAFARPPDLLEILIYDTAGLVTSLAAQGRLISRSVVRSALAAIKDHPAVTGLWTMSTSGQVERELYLLSIHKRRIVTEAGRAAAQASKGKKRRRGR